jgi:hypothetical protein
MPPKLAEILGLENPWDYPGLRNMTMAWEKGLNDAWAKLVALRVSGKEAGTVGYAGPGWLLWIPENKVDDVAEPDSAEAMEMFECVG